MLNAFKYVVSDSYRKHRWASKNLWIFRLSRYRLMAMSRLLKMKKINWVKVISNC